jgi:hypothetical protein
MLSINNPRLGVFSSKISLNSGLNIREKIEKRNYIKVLT